MNDSYPFITYSGLFEPKHYKQIGSALWLFLWCISSTTREEEIDGVTWGVVHGSKPKKIGELEEIFGVTDKTVRLWIKTLEQHGYIKVTRAPYGLIFSVRNSKKFANSSVNNDRSGSVESYRSLEGERQNITDQEDRAVNNDRSGSVESYRCNKDINELTTISTKQPIIQLIDAYCSLHNKIEFHLKDKERTLMFKMIGDGIPVPLIIETMQAVYRERSAETNITSFLYYKSIIYQAWETAKAITEGVPASPVALGEESITGRVSAPVVALGSPRRTKQQQQIDDLERFIEEEKRRGSG